jgi:ABC-type sulfate/molybdate transport systems ATPase subunit
LLKIQDVSCSYEKKQVLNNVTFEVTESQIIAIVGESGSGKTTLLKAIQGLLDLDAGQIVFNNQVIPQPKDVLVPGVDGIATVYQDFNLQNGLTVFHNIKHHINHLKLDDQYQFTQEIIELCNMTDFKDQKPKNISGGQKQKTALAMALVSEPQLILLDEPFSHLDQISKTEFIDVILRVKKELNISFVFVTHNPEEALKLSDKLIILKDGDVIVNSKTSEVFNHLNSVYASKLLGVKNIFTGKQLGSLLSNIKVDNNYHIPQNAITLSKSDQKTDWTILEIPSANIRTFSIRNKNQNITLEYFTNELTNVKDSYFNVNINADLVQDI